MERRARAAGARSWAGFLGRAIVFPLAWVWALGIARRHHEADPRGRSKVLAAILVGIVLTAGVGFLLYDFQEDARAGMYDQTHGRIAVAVGESAWQEQWATINASNIAIGILDTRLAEAQATGDEANVTIFEATKANVTADRDAAIAGRDDLEENHEFFVRIQPWIADQQDERVMQAIRDAEFQTSQATAQHWNPDRMVPRAERAFAINDAAEQDMWQVMAFLLVPGLIGVFYAPLFFALGGIMLRAWDPSQTVGFKPYPGRALGWFLLLGGFGWPSLLFSAWGFRDIEIRTQEGQIAL